MDSYRQEQPKSMETADKGNKNRRVKTVIGLLLLIAVAYFILTNFDFGDWPALGFAIRGPGQTCTEIRGPKVMSDTVIEQLEVEDLGFRILRNENKAVLKVRNKDERAGEVRVTLYCRNGYQQGDQEKDIDPGETETFRFLDVSDCELDYIIEQENVKRRVNKTVYVTDSVCE